MLGGAAIIAIALCAGGDPPAVVAMSAPPAVAPSAIGALPSHDAADVLLAALAPAPQKIVLETRSFGTVTVDHAAHLARRSACRSCHGPGPIAKIGRFEPRVAHERCIGCHRQERRGPTGCRDCHDVPPRGEPADALTAAADPAAAASTAAPGKEASPGAPPAALAAATSAEAVEPEARPHQVSRILGVGFVVMGGARQELTSGPTVQSTMRDDDLVLLYAVELGTSARGGRTAGLVGAGLARPLPRTHWSGFAAVVGGFAAIESPLSFVPSAGLRIGAEWLKGRMSLTVAATGSSDLVRRVNRLGERVGDVTWGLTASCGWVLARR